MNNFWFIAGCNATKQVIASSSSKTNKFSYHIWDLKDEDTKIDMRLRCTATLGRFFAKYALQSDRFLYICWMSFVFHSDIIFLVHLLSFLLIHFWKILRAFFHWSLWKAFCLLATTNPGLEIFPAITPPVEVYWRNWIHLKVVDVTDSQCRRSVSIRFWKRLKYCWKV